MPNPPTIPNPSAPGSAPGANPRRTRRISAAGVSLLAYGEPMVFLTGGALALCLLMILGLLALVGYHGLRTFWPAPTTAITLADGRTLLGEETRAENYAVEPTVLSTLTPAIQQHIRQNHNQARRTLYRTGNFELTGEHFHWVSDYELAQPVTQPPWALVVERLEWGRFYGYPEKFLRDGQVVADDPAGVWEAFQQQHGPARQRWELRRHLEKDAIGLVNARLEAARLNLREAELDHGPASPAYQQALQKQTELKAWAEGEFTRIKTEIQKLNDENARYQLVLRTSDGRSKTLEPAQIVRAYPANQLGFFAKLGVYFSRWGEFLSADPREANSEGGVFPAIFGTVLMTLIMSLAVVPLGVLAALYLREYAKDGLVVSAVRIAVNNLAGVPSIVFGVFGLAFFIYGVGAFIDGGPRNALGAQTVLFTPAQAWLAVVLIVILVVVASWASFVSSRPLKPGQDRRRWLTWLTLALWLACVVLLVTVVIKSPFFHGFFRAQLLDKQPTFGKGGLLWASLTLALLTLPVVIVATEEALAAVPSSMREGSYACGASKWQTIRRIVLPRALPGIMTGTILAMARGAGEVAPLMIVGAVKLALELPLDTMFPFFHPERSFMHLGFHIYDVGFQSPNSEAARPMVYTTTLLLIAIVVLLNIAAIALRTRLRRRFVAGQF